MTNLDQAVDTLVENIKASYATMNFRAEMTNRFNDSLETKTGKKYIKVLHTTGGVWGFVVATDTDAKFQKGDILKAAGWASPARNFSRGNVFTGNYKSTWTGA